MRARRRLLLSLGVRRSVGASDRDVNRSGAARDRFACDRVGASRAHEPANPRAPRPPSLRSSVGLAAVDSSCRPCAPDRSGSRRVRAPISPPARPPRTACTSTRALPGPAPRRARSFAPPLSAGATRARCSRALPRGARVAGRRPGPRRTRASSLVPLAGGSRAAVSSAAARRSAGGEQRGLPYARSGVL